MEVYRKWLEDQGILHLPKHLELINITEDIHIHIFDMTVLEMIYF